MRRILMGLTVAALGLPVVARAQAQYQEPRYVEGEKETWAKPSVGIMADIGVDKYNLDVAHDVNAGIGYGARVDISPQRNIGLELSYHGAVNNLSSNISGDGRLITNQVGGDLRLNAVPADRELPGDLKPFVFGGAYYHRIDTDNFTPGFRDNINAFALPVGLGLEADLGERFLIGGRFTYNFLFNENDKFGGRNADFWAATVNLGTRLFR